MAFPRRAATHHDAGHGSHAGMAFTHITQMDGPLSHELPCIQHGQPRYLLFDDRCCGSRWGLGTATVDLNGDDADE